MGLSEGRPGARKVKKKRSMEMGRYTGSRAGGWSEVVSQELGV